MKCAVIERHGREIENLVIQELVRIYRAGSYEVRALDGVTFTIQAGEMVVSEMVFHHSQKTLAVKRTLQAMPKGIAHPVTLYVVESMGGAT